MWQKRIIHNLCEITSSKRIYVADYQSEGVPFFRGKEIIEKHKGNLEVSTELFISEDKFLDIKNRFGVPQPGDLLLTSVGTLGVPYVVKPGEKFYFKDGNLTWFRLFKNLDSQYLCYWLISPQGKAQLKKCTIGSSQPAFTIVLLKDMEIQLPPFHVQRRIAAILSAYDDLIENNLRRIKILEEMALALYREWFVKFRFPSHQKVKMVNSPLGKIPEGWEVKKATDAIAVNPTTKVPREGEKSFVSMGNLSNDSMLINGFELRSGNSGSKFSNGDTLFARITPCLENGKTAYVQFLPSDSDVAFGSTEFIVLRSKTLCPELVYFIARSIEFRGNAIKSMSGAGGRQRVQEACFDKFLFAHPDPNNVSMFAEQIAPIFRYVHTLSRKNDNIRQTRDLLLPKLISGELDVSELDITIREANA